MRGRSSATRRSTSAIPMIEQALEGQRTFFAAEFDHPHARRRCGAERLYPVGRRSDRRSARDHRPGDGRDRAARRREGAARERGAVPADRQLGAGDDVGDPARPGARLRQRSLCRVHRPAASRRRGCSTGAAIHPDDVERIVAESIAGEASASRSPRGALSAPTGVSLAASVSQPRFGPDGELSGSSGWRPTSPGQGGRARLRAGRGADARAGAVEARFRRVRHGARSAGADGAGRDGRRAQPQGSSVAGENAPRRRNLGRCSVSAARRLMKGR